MSDKEGIRQTRHEIAPFFGSHGGAELFIKLFIETAPGYLQSVNETDPTNIVNYPHAYSLMRAEDYNRKEIGMSNNDVHYEFTDFIIQTALLFRSIDQPTGRGAVRLEDFRTFLRTQFTDPTPAVKDPYGFGKVTGTASTGIFGGTFTADDQIFNVATGLSYGQAKRNLGISDPIGNAYPQIKKVLALIVGLMYTGTPLTLNPRVTGEARDAVNFVINGAGRADEGLVNRLLLNREIDSKINEYISRLPPANQATFKSTFENQLRSTSIIALNEYTNGLYGQLRGKPPADAARDVVTDTNATQLAQILENAILQALNNAYATTIPASPTLAQPAPGQSAPAQPSSVNQIFTNVFGNWNNLSQGARNFYKRFIQLLRYDQGSKTWVPVPENEYGTPIDPRNIGSYRINVIKTTLGEEAPAFVNLIPKFTRRNNIFNDIWYTDKSGKHVKITTANWKEDEDDLNGAQNFFKNLFVTVYTGRNSVRVKTGNPTYETITIDPPAQWSPTMATMFDLNVDQFVRKRFFRIQQELKQPPIVKGPVLSLTDKNVWKVDEQGRLYLDDPSGRVYYGENEPGSLKALKNNFKCFSTFAKVEGDECNRYVNQCLLRNDTESLKVCAEMWKRGDFYTISKEEIKNMHPLVAVRTLQKFGFRIHKVEDTEMRMLIKKFETVDHWVKHVLTKAWGQQQVQLPTSTGTGASSETLQSIIEKNENILNYLRLLVEYVNSNPAIMNGRELAGRTAEAAGRVERSELTRKLGIPMVKEPKKGPMTTFYDYTMLRSHLESGFLGQTMRRRPFTSAFGTTFTGTGPSPIGFQGSPQFRSPFSSSIYGLNVPFQLGGLNPDINSYLRRRESGIISGAESLFGLIRVTVEDLKSMGKIIDEGDLTSIENKVVNMKSLESELIKTETYLEEYKYLMELFKDHKSEILTLETIKGLVEKQKDLISKQTTEENTLVKILGSLQGLRQGKCEDFVNDDCEYEKATIDVTQLPPPKQPDCIPKQKIC